MFSVGALVGYCIDTYHKTNQLTPYNNTNVKKNITIWCVMCNLNDDSLLCLPLVILEQMSIKMPSKKWSLLFWPFRVAISTVEVM
jgi:hypothetical protein